MSLPYAVVGSFIAGEKSICVVDEHSEHLTGPKSCPHEVHETRWLRWFGLVTQPHFGHLVDRVAGQEDMPYTHCC